MKNIFLILPLFFFTPSAHAYLEMVRNGYVNCTTCHISTNGGGVLNDYGRELSREMVATFKSADEKSKEHQFLYGVMDETPIQKWLKLGGDVKGIYYYQKTPTTKKGRFVFMQGDFEAAATFGQWTIDATLGAAQLASGFPAEFIARRHYIKYSYNDELSFRFGKYVPAYGLNTPDHLTITRSGLSIGNFFETYNLEAAYVNDRYNVFLTGLFGRPDDIALNLYTGAAVQGSYAPNEHMKIGVEGMYNTNKTEKRILAGPFATLGFTPDLMLQTEMDFLFRTPNGGIQTTGFLSTQKLSYVAFEGGWLYLLQEWGNYNIDTAATHIENYGLGLQFFPRTHFEINLAYELMKSGSASPFSNIAWLMTHFYL